MFRGETGGFCARVDSQLAVDGAQVPIDGAGTNEELLCDLGVGEPGSDQAQHFGLPDAESGGVCLRGGGLGGCHLLQGVLYDLLARHRPPLRPRRPPCCLIYLRARSYLTPIDGAVGYIGVHRFDLLEQ